MKFRMHPLQSVLNNRAQILVNLQTFSLILDYMRDMFPVEMRIKLKILLQGWASLDGHNTEIHHGALCSSPKSTTSATVAIKEISRCHASIYQFKPIVPSHVLDLALGTVFPTNE